MFMDEVQIGVSMALSSVGWDCVPLSLPSVSLAEFRKHEQIRGSICEDFVPLEKVKRAIVRVPLPIVKCVQLVIWAW